MSGPPPAARGQAVFTQGSLMRHVVTMTATGSIGLIAVFVVDFLSLLYISWLKDETLTAGVGYATTVSYFVLSINIGTMIALGALVSRALGRSDRAAARRIAASGVWLGLTATILMAALVIPFLRPLLQAIGAHGAALDVAERFLWITLPFNPLMGVGMACSGVLRAVGDARRAMNVTLIGGVVTAFMDPLLIFGLGYGVWGAAVATVVSRLVICAIGLYGVVRVHDLLARPTLESLRADAAPLVAIAGPAVLTNLGTPVSFAFILRVLARYGDAIIAGNTILDRLTPLCFGVIFALSGSVGPILGQNWGAGRYDRLRLVLRESALLVVIYTTLMGITLLLLRHSIPHLFHVEGAAADFIAMFCLYIGVLWAFLGALFVANAAFNNLGFPLLSTAFNWTRALATLPVATLGAAWGGPEGVVIGVTGISVVVGTAALLTAFRKIGQIEARDRAAAAVAAPARAA